MYKDLDSKGGKLQFGPVWDLNLAYGNSDFGPEPLPTGWTWERTEASAIFPFWVYRLMQADTLRNRIACRWQELRESTLQTENLLNFIDTNLEYIEEARIRNFQRWPVLGLYVWPNYYVGTDYGDEVNYLTGWLQDRLAWMDENMVGECIPVSAGEEELAFSEINVFPNPFNEYVTFIFNKWGAPARIEIYNASSTLLRSIEVGDGSSQKLYLGDLEPGMYFYRVVSEGAVLGSGKLVKR
jgi:hypothetical protein